MKKTTFINILLADDDKDDCLFFKEAIEELPFATSLAIVHDGDQLMEHLENVSAQLPHVLFLDLNMPRKNGFECLEEIKKHAILKHLPIIVYSTSYDIEKINQLYKTGANHYICKPTDFEELKKVVYDAIVLVKQNDIQTSKANFVVSKLKPVF